MSSALHRVALHRFALHRSVSTRRVFSIGLLLAALWAGPAGAEDEASPSAPVDAETKQAVIERITELLDEHYVFPDVAAACAESLRSDLESGTFDGAEDEKAFADALTEAIQKVSKDKHINVWLREPERVDVERQNPMRARAESTLRQKRANFGFEKVEKLDGNVGYVDLRYFAGHPQARETVVGAMAFLANVDALIFDMRKNGGGSPDMVRFISSYLFAEPTHLNSLYWRRGDRTDEFWTLENVPGKRLADVPVFVLTSKRTFSGAEEFSYNLRTRERGTLIGETTGGGANPGDTMNIDDRFAVFVPTGRAINPITGTNWEGVGVAPHIAVEADKAFDVALEKAQAAAEARRQELDAAAATRWTDFESGMEKAEQLVADGKSDAAGARIQETLRQALDRELITEADINQLGYHFLQGGQALLAIATFEANVAAFPESANVYDSLGEAQMETGRNEAAVANYRKSLQLDPENRNAVDMLQRLGVKAAP